MFSEVFLLLLSVQGCSLCTLCYPRPPQDKKTELSVSKPTTVTDMFAPFRSFLYQLSTLLSCLLQGPCATAPVLTYCCVTFVFWVEALLDTWCLSFSPLIKKTRWWWIISIIALFFQTVQIGSCWKCHPQKTGYKPWSHNQTTCRCSGCVWNKR